MVLAAVLASALFVSGAYLWQVQRVRSAKVTEARERNQVMIVFVDSRLKQAAAWLLALAGDGEGSELVQRQSPNDRFIQLASSIVELNRDVDTVRLLSLTGREVIRVQDGGEIVPEEQLQEKGHSKYFEIGRDLKVGEVGLSEFDLNVEHDEVELPPKPVARLMTPMPLVGGEITGIAVINLSLQRLFETMDRTYPRGNYEIELLGPDGFWEWASDPSKEWGDQIVGREDLTLAKMRPLLWKAIWDHPSGQRVEGGDIYVWSRSRLGSSDSTIINDQDTSQRNDHVVLSRIPAEDLAATLEPIRWIALALFLLTSAGASALVLNVSARTHERRAGAARLRAVFASAPVSLLEEDWSDVEQAVQELRASGVSNLGSYLTERPEAVEALQQRVRINDVNEEAIALFKADGRKQLLGPLKAVWVGEAALATFRMKLLAWVDGRRSFSSEITMETLQGAEIDAQMQVSFSGEGEEVDRAVVGLIDITERMKVERELGEQRVLLHKVEQVAKTGSWRWDLAGDRLVWSKGLFEIFGRSPLDGVPAFDDQAGLFTDASWQKLRAVVSAATEYGREYRLDLELTNAPGRTNWIEVQGYPVKDDRGQVIELYGFVRDITERRETEGETRLLAAIASRTDNLVVIADSERRIEWVNQAFADVTGYSPGEVRGRCLEEVLLGSEGDPAVAAAVRADLASAEAFSVEIMTRRKNGRDFWARLRLDPLHCEEGGVTHFTAVLTDLTLEKAREAEILTHSMLLERTSEISNVGGWEFDVEAMVPIWTKQARRIHEVDDDFVPTLENALGFYPEEPRAVLAAAFQKSLETGESGDLEMPFLTAKGRKIVVRIKWTVQMRDGRATRVCGVLRDVSERRAIERELVEARERAESANVAKSQFVANMSHEIRTPLNAVLGMCDLLQDSPSPADAREYLATIRASGDALLDLISDILSFSKGRIR